MHTTPGNALVLAYGRTRSLVVTTALSCILSMFLNIALAPYYGVGAAIISYFLYVIVVIGLYYFYYYKKLLKLSRFRMLMSFLKPTAISALLLLIVSVLPVAWDVIDCGQERITYIIVFIIKTILWIIPYFLFLFAFRVISIEELKK